jgi:integrase/recombinase XerC/integrase/recombinase XerD
METTLPVLLDLFVATKQTEGKSRNTTIWYNKRLSDFVRFIGEDPKLPDFTVANARAFVAHLQERVTRYDSHPISPIREGGLSAFTIHSYVRAIKAFSSWLNEEGFISTNVMSRMKRPALPKPMIEVLTDEEIDRLVNSLNPNTFLGLRLLTTVLLFLDTGIRASEILGLKVDDLDWANGTLRVWGKGNKQRQVSFDPQTKKYLLRYINAFRPEPANPNHKEILLSVQGTPLTYDALSHLVKRAGENVGIPRLHAHLFRHTFAVKYLMNGGDVMTLKLILGHTSLDVTQVYMHLAESQVKIQHERFSPVSRLKISHRKRGAS